MWLICTFPSRHYDIDDYPAVKNYLLSFGVERLEQTGKTHIINGEKVSARKKTMNKWFETQDSIGYWDDFSKQKIVWSRLTRISKKDFDDFPRFALVKNDYVVLDSLCFCVGDNLNSLLDVLNSKFAAYYFFNNVAILDNGGLQMRQQYVENIPVPNTLLSISKSQLDELDKSIFDSFHFTQEEIAFINNFLLAKKHEIESNCCRP